MCVCAYIAPRSNPQMVVYVIHGVSGNFTDHHFANISLLFGRRLRGDTSGSPWLVSLTERTLLRPTRRKEIA